MRGDTLDVYGPSVNRVHAGSTCNLTYDSATSGSVDEGPFRYFVLQELEAVQPTLEGDSQHTFPKLVYHG